MALWPKLGVGLCAATLGTTFSIATARADAAHSFELTWQAPASCPTRKQVEREIVRLIGEGSPGRSMVHAHGEVSRKNDDWTVQIRIQDGDRVSDRTFDGRSCRAVTKVASLIIALAIEPNVDVTPDAAPAPETTPAPPAEPAPNPVRDVAPAPAALKTSPHFFASIGPVGELRLLPRAAVGLSLGVGVRWTAISAEVRVSATLPQSTDVAGGGPGGRFFLATAAARICAPVNHGNVEFFGCGGALIDRIGAEGYGVTAPGSAAPIVVSAGAGPRIDLRLGESARASLAADATYAFAAPNFQLDNIGSVHRAAAFGGTARVDIIWLF